MYFPLCFYLVDTNSKVDPKIDTYGGLTRGLPPPWVLAAGDYVTQVSCTGALIDVEIKKVKKGM